MKPLDSLTIVKETPSQTKLQVKILSTEMIKPSTPTSSHLKSYKLCLLDQFFGLTFVPQVLFYSNSPINGENTNNSIVDGTKIIITRLKESLSKTLSLFYPLAGRLTADESTVNCNDEGIAFIEARANVTLGEFLKAPNRVDQISHFIPGINTRVVSASEVVPLAVQVSAFECGGVAMGSQYLHKIFDGASWSNFLNSWAAVATERDDKVVTPDFTTATSLFPPCSRSSKRNSTPLTTRPLGGANYEDGNCVVRAFVFTHEAITNLQARAKSELAPNPTRIEALSGFIWKHAMAAAAACKSEVKVLGPSVLFHSVNMRPRMNPPMPSTTIGNLIIHASASFEGKHHLSSDSNSAMDLQHLVAETRKGLSEAKDSAFLSRFKGEKGNEAIRLYKQNLEDISNAKNVTTYKFTSWSKLDVLPDFGFIGMPVWIGFASGKLSPKFKNLITLIEIPACGGIEAWLILEEQEMSVLQTDAEFLELASPTS